MASHRNECQRLKDAFYLIAVAYDLDGNGLCRGVFEPWGCWGC